MSIFKKKTQTAGCSSSDAVSAPVFEALEPRELLTAAINGGILEVFGSEGENWISISRFGRGGDMTRVAFKGDFKAKFAFPTMDFTGINVQGFGGDDSIMVAPNIAQNATLIGATGDDTLMGGAGADALEGGEGNDTLHQAPNDILIGNTPDDTVLFLSGYNFENGKLTILGGSGKDKIRVTSLGNGSVGFTINNVLYGPFAGVTMLCVDGRGEDDKIDLDGSFPDGMGDPLPITVLGRGGTDKIDVEDGRNVSINGGDGDDRLSVGQDGAAGPGHATLTGGAGTDSFKVGLNDEITDQQDGEKVKRK